MKKILNILLVIGLLTLLFLPLVPVGQVEADSPYEQLAPGEIRLSPNTKVVRIGGSTSSDTYIATISSLPETMLDLKTKITTKWNLKTGIDGVSYYETGTNLFYAKVTDTRVTVQFEGKQAAWDPTVVIGDVVLKLKSGPTIIDDPLNEYYSGNTIEWTYAAELGWFIFSREYTVTRYLRQIEGYLQEYYKLPYNPKGNVVIYPGYEEDYGYIWELPATAWDSNNRAVKVGANNSSKFISASELRRSSIKYPIYVDPPQDFLTLTTNDAILGATYGDTYSSVHDATTGFLINDTFLEVGQAYDDWGEGYKQYCVLRGGLVWDTSSLTTAAVISSTTVGLYISSLYADTAWSLQIQYGGGTYPRSPIVAADYNKAYYSGNGGSLTSSGIVTGMYNYIELNPDGRSWINKVGYTRLIVRNNRDVSNTAPTGYEHIGSYQREYGSNRAPKLTVTYTIPIVRPTINTYSATNIGETTATLNGYLTYDGGAPCSVRFSWGTTSGVYTAGSTEWQAGKTTEFILTKDVVSFIRGVTYYYTMEATHGEDLSNPVEKIFTTKPGKPTNFSAAPGSQKNDLTWTKGEGSDKTMIRYSTTSSPTSPTSGSQAYFDTSNSYSHTGLTDGITYYYSAWGELGGVYSPTYTATSGVPVTAGPPTVITYDATNVGTTTAKLHGYLNSLGGYGSADVWFQYYWGAGTWIDHETTPETKTATGSFEYDISTLPASTIIYFRAASLGSGGYGYGSSNSFKTGDPSAPQMQTNAASGVTKTVATLYGEVVDDGGAVVTAWFQWGTTTGLGFETATAAGLFTDDTLYASLTDAELDPSITYYFRVVGQNDAGTGYGTVLNFTTDPPDIPSVTTIVASGISATEATLKGQLTNGGGVSCRVRFEWGTDEGLGTYTSWMEGYISGQIFSYLLGSLNISETYYYQAEADNAGGSDEGEILSFTTVFGPPEGLMAYSLGTDSISLKWEKIGDQTGIFMKAGSFPVDRFDGQQVYFGPAESCSVMDLDEGTTYFFRAWSWRSGNIWSDEYAEQAATTGAASATTEPTDMGWGFPDAPDDYTQDPSGNAFEDWPFYDLIEDSATASGLVPGSLWLIITLIFISALLVCLFVWTGNLLIVIIGGTVLIVIAGMMGLVPTWIAAVFIVIGGGLGYVTKSA